MAPSFTWKATIRDNLQLGYWVRGNRANGHSEKAAFDEVFALFPKLTQILERPGGVLSGGEQQQLAIGRALLSNPKVLLLDESTEGIQPSIVDQIEDVIIEFKTAHRFDIVLVEQGLHFAARLADSDVVMAKGAVVGGSGKVIRVECRRCAAASDCVVTASRCLPARATRGLRRPSLDTRI